MYRWGFLRNVSFSLAACASCTWLTSHQKHFRLVPARVPTLNQQSISDAPGQPWHGDVTLLTLPGKNTGCETRGHLVGYVSSNVGFQ